MAMEIRPFESTHRGVALNHLLAILREGYPQPAVLVFPTFAGRGDLELAAAERLADQGVIGVAVDLYGGGRRGATREECAALMKPFMEDRAFLRDRLLHVLEAVKAVGDIDAERIGAIGFCFGGLCALDLARSGAAIRCTASFHGLLKPNGLPPEPIGGKVAVYHGADDPMAPPSDVEALAQELTAAGADWQIQAYQGVMHGFTNPAANDPEAGIRYDQAAAERSWASLEALLSECFSR
ncbi:MAG TPA: dienelactone hydrolase family protein [Allosphingosinicella sp.]|jgi:dienelactone hydrolase